MAYAIPPLSNKKDRLCLLCGQYIELNNFKWEPHIKECEKIYIARHPGLQEFLEHEQRDKVIKKFKTNRE